MRKNIKKILCIIISLLVVFSSVEVVIAANAPSYPAGVTAKQALNAVKGTDKLLGNAMPLLTGKSMKALITSSLYTSDTLSSVLVSIYTSMEENADVIKLLGVDTSTRGVAKKLRAYPDVSAELFNCESWDGVNLQGANWKVKNKTDFAKALGAILSPFNDILYALLCGGSYEMNKYITIKGGMGYMNSIIPLYKSLKISSYCDNETFLLNAEKNKNTMVQNIVVPVLSWLEKVASKPADTLTDSLPSFAYYVESGELNRNFALLLKPIAENPIVELASVLKIFDLNSLNLDVNEIITSMSSEGELKLAPINLSALAACGKNTSKGFKSDKGLAYVQIMQWIIETLKLNKETLGALPGGEMDLSAVSGLLEADTNKLTVFIIQLFSPGKTDNPKAMVYPDFKTGKAQYTRNLKARDLKRVYNQADDLLDQFVKEGGTHSSIESVLKKEIYKNSNINALLKGVFGALEDSGMMPLLELLSIDCSPKGVAAHLKEGKYSSAKKALSKANSWKKVSLKGVAWGFADGSRKGFSDALTAVLRPLAPMLRVVLAGENMLVLDSVYINGADGYNTAVIPILEALGCKSSSIKTYKAYKASSSGDGVVENLLDPVFDLVDDVCEKPVKTLVRILPNAVYFMNSGSLEKCIENLLIPVTSITNKLPQEVGPSFDASSLTKELDFEKLMSSLLNGSGMKIAEFKLKDIASLGKATKKTSKATFNGKRVKYTYIEADVAGVTMELLRVVAKTMRMPGNENILMGSMGSMGGAAASFDTSAITKELEGMSEDEFIEWFVNLFFKERVKFQLVEKEGYSPTIIFEKQEEDYTKLYVFLGYLGVCLVVGAIIFFNRKRLYGNSEDNVC